MNINGLPKAAKKIVKIDEIFADENLEVHDEPEEEKPLIDRLPKKIKQKIMSFNHIKTLSDEIKWNLKRTVQLEKDLAKHKGSTQVLS